MSYLNLILKLVRWYVSKPMHKSYHIFLFNGKKNWFYITFDAFIIQSENNKIVRKSTIYVNQDSSFNHGKGFVQILILRSPQCE